MRFDEVELEVVPLGLDEEQVAPVVVAASTHASRWRRLMAFLTDLSLFAALVLVLYPLLSRPLAWAPTAALAGFVALFSYYYYVGTWLLWGKTIGGAIFDVRVVAAERASMTMREASLRWAGLYLSFATAGIGFILALLPSRRSLSDRMSDTHCVTA